MKKLTEETKRTLIDLYENSDLTIAQIAERVGVSPNSVSNTVSRLGYPLRRPKNAKAKNKKCPKCKRQVDVKGARFCPYCGGDLRSENELLAERLEQILDHVGLIPDSRRDEYIAVINETMAVLVKMQ